MFIICENLPLQTIVAPNMELKHKDQVFRLGCDLSRFTERNRDAFCWTFEDIQDPKNFLPRAIAVGRDECTAWALSFFETHSQAKARLVAITKDKEYLYKKLGTHIAEGVLEPKDGISEDANGHGHFNHFEYIGTDFRETFKVIL